MNTVFKLGYQACLLLGARRGAARCRGPGAWLPRRGVAAVGGRRRASLLLLGARLPVRGQLRAQGRLRRSPTLDGLGWLRASVARRPGGDRLAARAHARRRRSCSRRSATTTRPSATRASRRSPAAPTVHRLGRPRAPVGARPRLRASADVKTLYTTTDVAEARAADRPLRRRLRRRRPDRAHRLRRRRAGEVGPARPPRVRPRRHDRVGAQRAGWAADAATYSHSGMPPVGFHGLALGEPAPRTLPRRRSSP